MLGQLGHEAQHREVGVAVHEHVLDELLGREAVDRVGVAAGALREPRQDPLPVLAGIGAPLAGGVDHVGLDVEDELVAGEHALGRRGLERRLARQAEGAAGVAARGEGLVERQERRRRAAQRLQEGAARDADPGRRARSMRSAASALARVTVSVTGTGRNSPFEVGSILIGSLRAPGRS